MRSPSIKTLVSTFTLERSQARLIKRLAATVSDRDALQELIEASCPETDSYARKCHGDPYASGMWRRTLVLHAIDCIMGTCGVESLHPEGDYAITAPPYEYLNAGDTYATTLIYKRETDNLYVSSWGDVVERDRSFRSAAE